MARREVLRVFYMSMAVTALSTTALSANADANDDRAHASEFFSAGQQAFAKRDFTRAAIDFEAAAHLVPSATAWLNAEEARERAGDNAGAAEDCDRSLADPTTSPQTTSEAQRRLSLILPTISTLTLTSTATPAATLRVDNEENEIKAPTTRRLKPGPHVLARTDRGSPQPSLRIVLELAHTTTLDVDQAFFSTTPLAPLPPIRETDRGTPSKRPAPSSGFHGPPLPSYVAFGAGAALAIVGGGFGVATLHAQSAYDDAPTHANYDDFGRDKFFTNLTLSWAASAVVAGLVIWWLEPHETR